MPLAPTQIPGLKLWLDAEDAASFAYSSGQLVSSWLDKSPTGYHFAQATPANQPSRNTTRNGRPTVAFDGSRYMLRQVATPFTNVAATIFAVVVETGTHRDYAGYIAATVTTGNDYDQVNGFDLNNGATGGPYNFLADRAGAGGIINGAPPTPFSVHTVTFAPGACTPYRNGVAGTPGAATSGGTPPGLCLGSRWLNAVVTLANGMRGEWAELLIYDRVLSADERKQIEEMLYAKWINPQANQQYLDLADAVFPWEDLKTTGLVVSTPLLPADGVAVTDAAVFSNDHVLSLSDSVAVSDQAFIGFSPPDFSGLKLWLDAARLTPGSLDDWANLAAGGFALTGVGTPSAVVRTGELGINGSPVVRLTASQRRFYSAVNTGIDRDFTFFIVARMYGGSNQRVVGGYNANPNFLIGWHGGDQDVLFMEGWVDGVSGGIPVVVNAVKSYAVDAQTTGFAPRMFLDGTQIRGAGGGATSGWQGYFSINDVFSAQYSNVDIGEVVFYNRKLTDVERQQVEQYLRTKWITPGAALTLNLSDSVTVSDTADLGFQFTQGFTDSVTVSEALGLEVSLTFADGVNTSDELVQPFGAFWEVTADDSVATSDLLGIALGEYIIPCTPDPVVGNFLSGGAVAGTWFACAKKGILGLGAYAPVLDIHNLAASPAGLGLGTNAPLMAWQPPQIVGAGMLLGGVAPGLSFALGAPAAGLRLFGRVPLNVGIEPEIYPAGLLLGGENPVFAGREPPVVSAGLGLGGIVPGFKFTHRLAAPPAGLALGGGPPVQVEQILVITSAPFPIDLLPSPESDQVLLSTGAPVALDLLSATAVPVTLGDVDAVPADLNEVECV